MTEFENETQLDDVQLLDRLRRCVAEERGATARLLAHLGEVDARGLYRDEGFSSMFEYSVRALHMSESEAGLRIRVARLGRRFPAALQMLARGELHLTALRLLAPVLTHENDHLLADARFMTKDEVLALLAKHFPQADVPSLIRRLPSRDGACGAAPASTPLLAGSPASDPAPPDNARVCKPLAARVEVSSVSNLREVPQPSASRAGIPLSTGRFKVQFTACQRLRDKLELSEHLLRHQIPNGDIAAIIERALDLLIAQRKKQIFAETARPRAAPEHDHTLDALERSTDRPENAPPTGGSRHIPRAVRRAVIARDGTQCSFVSADGRRCSERGGLEFHHEQPFARGGVATTANIRVMCRVHNGLLAERDFGRAFMVSRSTSKRVPEPVGPSRWHGAR